MSVAGYKRLLFDRTTQDLYVVKVDGVACNLDSICLLYTSPSPRDGLLSRMPSSA